MLGSAKIKFLKSLHRKKERWEEKMFLLEGFKTIQEFIFSNVHPIEVYVVKEKFREEDLTWLSPFKVIYCSAKEMSAISQLSTAPGLAALFPFFNYHVNYDWLKTYPALYLDNIKDPGNLGTIIRSCDWFGLPQIFCSIETVELYNSKVLQSSMGSCARVSCVYIDFDVLYNNIKKLYPDFFFAGTFLNGSPIKEINKIIPNSNSAIYVIGNESFGISKEVSKSLTERFTIPKCQDSQAESLNASLAATLLLYEVFRK